jgi:hypothetical protein
MNLKYEYDVVSRNSVLIFGLFFMFSLFLIVCLLPTQLYGSTISCDPPANLTNCMEASTSSSSASNTGTTGNSRSDDTLIPLTLPDISPRDEDLHGAMTDENLDTSEAENTDNPRQNLDADGENERESNNNMDSSNSADEPDDDGPSLLPFP